MRLASERFPDQRDSRRQVLFHQRRGNAQHPKPSPPELCVPPDIQCDLPGMVEVPIHLHDETSRPAEKVHDVIADDLLPTKLHPEPLAPNAGPEEHFRVRGMMPHEAARSRRSCLRAGD